MPLTSHFGYETMAGGGSSGKAVSLIESDDVKRICAGRYMDYVEDLESRIDLAAASVQRQKSRLDVMGVNYEGAGSSGVSRDGLPDGVAALLDVLDQASADLIEYKEQRAIAEEVIAQLPSLSMRKLMRAHYLSGTPWVEIESRGFYSHSGLMSLRRRALICVYDVMPEEWRRVLPKAL